MLADQIGTHVMIGKILVIIGSGVFVLAVAVTAKTRAFVHNAERAEGVVVGLLAGGSHPQIKFATASQQIITYAQGGLIWGYRPGDHVTILYLSHNPKQTACINTFGALWFYVLILYSLGLILALVGVQN